MPSAADTPANCEIRDWTVFRPGYHKGDLYTPADVQRLAENFAALSSGEQPYLTPVGKIGHDKHQRLSQSLGFLNVGRIVDAGLDDAGNFVIRRMVDVPALVGGEINAGHINSGSVELASSCPDPSDPSKTIRGPILTGVAFLGEEQPAVKGFAPPRAVYPDGSEVPPSTNPAPWLQAMADVARFSAEYADADADDCVVIGGRLCPVQTIRFSEMTPMMTRDQMIQQLTDSGFSPEFLSSQSDEQLKALCDQSGSEAFAAAMKKKYAEAPPQNVGTPAVVDKDHDGMSDAPAWAKQLAETCKQMSDAVGDITKRVGSVEAKMSEDAKKDEESKMSAFSERVSRDVAQRITAMKLLPRDKDRFVAEGVQVLTTKQFSTVVGDAEKAYSAFLSDLDGRPSYPAGAVIKDLPAGNKNPIDPDTRIMAAAVVRKNGFLDKQRPQLASKLRQALAN
jgi:hypothetical protein